MLACVRARYFLAEPWTGLLAMSAYPWHALRTETNAAEQIESHGHVRYSLAG